MSLKVGGVGGGGDKGSMAMPMDNDCGHAFEMEHENIYLQIESLVTFGKCENIMV